jgi:hypothetical protein
MVLPFHVPSDSCSLIAYHWAIQYVLHYKLVYTEGIGNQCYTLNLVGACGRLWQLVFLISSQNIVKFVIPES